MGVYKNIKTLGPEVMRLINDSGPLGLLRRVPAAAYRRGIRPYLPTTGHVRRNDVPTAQRKMFDNYVPNKWWHLTKPDQPDFEQALVSLQQNITQNGDDVIIIAGGWGVSMYYAQESVGAEGSVRAYEASDTQFRKLINVLSRLDIKNDCTVIHGLVGNPSHIYGLDSTATAIPPNELPECDVLELDCEGSELSILQGLSIRPRDIYVEIHPHIHEECKYVVNELCEMGYSIEEYFGHNGTKIGEDDFEYLMEYDRDENPPTTPIGAKHPPVVWARQIDYRSSVGDS